MCLGRSCVTWTRRRGNEEEDLGCVKRRKREEGGRGRWAGKNIYKSTRRVNGAGTLFKKGGDCTLKNMREEMRGEKSTSL